MLARPQQVQLLYQNELEWPQRVIMEQEHRERNTSKQKMHLLGQLHWSSFQLFLHQIPCPHDLDWKTLYSPSLRQGPGEIHNF